MKPGPPDPPSLALPSESDATIDRRTLLRGVAATVALRALTGCASLPRLPGTRGPHACGSLHCRYWAAAPLAEAGSDVGTCTVPVRELGGDP